MLSVQKFAILTRMDEPTRLALGKRLAASREAKGFTLDDVMGELYGLIPKSMRISRPKLSQLEKGMVAKVDPFDIEILAHVYDRPVEELSPEIAADLESYRNVVAFPGQETAGSPCSPTEPVAA